MRWEVLINLIVIGDDAWEMDYGEYRLRLLVIRNWMISLFIIIYLSRTYIIVHVSRKDGLTK